MENIIQLRPEEAPQDQTVELISGMVLGMKQMICDVHILTVALLHYAIVGAAVTDSLLDLIITVVPVEPEHENEPA